MEATYMNGKGVAKKGHVVMSPGNVRAIVIGIKGTFVRVRGIGAKKDTGETVMRDWIHDCPASECVLLEERLLACEETALGITYACGNCSWSISMPKEDYAKAKQLFDEHTCASGIG